MGTRTMREISSSTWTSGGFLKLVLFLIFAACMIHVLSSCKSMNEVFAIGGLSSNKLAGLFQESTKKPDVFQNSPLSGMTTDSEDDQEKYRS